MARVIPYVAIWCVIFPIKVVSEVSCAEPIERIDYASVPAYCFLGFCECIALASYSILVWYPEKCIDYHHLQKQLIP